MGYNINITNGTGTENVLNGTYNVGATVTGYDNTTITPDNVIVVEGTDSYAFTIAATGTLTLHVTEDGTAAGTPVVGATFIRTDSTGAEYGTAITSDASGNAVFANVPFASDGAPLVYFKQTASDGAHEFSTEVQSTTLTTQTATVEITNLPPAPRTFTLTDANYTNLPITGTLSLNN